jgi:hypothetical protein
MVLLNIDRYRYYGPLFEAARIALTYLDEKYSPEYMQGISGAAFKISGGCPSRPTCACDMWPADLLRKLGFGVTEYACADEQGNDISGKMIEAVKKQIDAGKPALVWHAFSNEEWDIVCGYDDEAKQFIGRGFLAGNGDDYARESWDRPKTSGVYGFGAIIIGAKTNEAVDLKALEIESLKNAVKHARTVSDDAAKTELTAGGFKYQNIDGIAFYNEWADYYSNEGADRDVADAYCLDIYSSVRKAAPLYLREIAAGFSGQAGKYLLEAADAFAKEADALAELWPLLTWSSPWGVDEERSKKAAPVIREAAGYYTQAVILMEKALEALTL